MAQAKHCFLALGIPRLEARVPELESAELWRLFRGYRALDDGIRRIQQDFERPPGASPRRGSA